MTTRAIRTVVCFAIVALFSAELAWAEFPKPSGSVTDAAHVLDETSTRALASLLHETEQQTSAEIAVVTVPSLDGMPVEEYANKLFQAWGIGKKGKDNGVLVLVAPVERRIRIEVGYGLEPILPDGLAGEIIRVNFTPAFKSGNYALGITQGTRRIAAIVAANHTLTADERRRLESSAADRPPALLMIPFFGLFVALGGFAVGAGVRSKTVVPIVWGALFGGIPLMMALVPFFNTSVWILGPFGLAMAALGYRKGGSWTQTLRAGKSAAAGTSGGGWVMGGGKSSGGSGGGFDSGSFGGGSSGGGGASGSW